MNSSVSTSEYIVLFNRLKKEINYPINLIPEWLDIYETAYSADSIYCQYHGDKEALGIIPLSKIVNYKTKLCKKITLQYLGRGPSDFFQPLVLPGCETAFASYFAQWLWQKRQLWDELYLSEIPAFWNGHVELAESLRKKYIVNVGQSSGFYYVDTTQDWDHYCRVFLNSNNKDLFKDLRQIERRDIQLRVTSHRDDIYAKLESALHLYAERRASLGQINTYETPQRKAFVKSVTEAYEKRGWVELSFLEDQHDNIWAFQLDWLYNGIRYHWNHAYNEDFKKYGPGKILLYKLMERAFHRPEEIQCNHMRGLTGYKSKLANQMEHFVDIRVYNPYSWRNRFAKAYHKLSHLKKAFQP